MSDLPVLVITSIVEDADTDLRVVIVAQLNGVDKISWVMTIKDGVACRDGNPYLVYGAAIEKFTGCDRYQTSITVADCRSGGLSNW